MARLDSSPRALTGSEPDVAHTEIWFHAAKHHERGPLLFHLLVIEAISSTSLMGPKAVQERTEQGLGRLLEEAVARRGRPHCKDETSSGGVTGDPVPFPSPPSGLQAFRFSMSEDEYVLFEFPVRTPPLPWPLPRIEAEVLRLVLAGCSNAEIALARGRSLRTIAAQVARLFRRLGVHSRMELVARVASGRFGGAA